MEFLEIYNQYYTRVRRFILALVKDQWVADDLIQETFLRVQQSLATLKDSSKLSSWIFRIAHNLCQDHFRQLKSARTKQGTGLLQTGDHEDGSIQLPRMQEELEQREMGRCVQNQIDLLPDPLGTVLVLFDIMECSHQEIADILGITVNNVKVRLHRARKQLKPILEEKCTFERDERNVLVCIPVDHGPKQCLGKNSIQGSEVSQSSK
ncbi:MAG: RNA polymerase sigma factor [Deltaproteobacteria bacterium]|nr:RNA polymerase sigma factor [Deltaproteobacteria bacterium]